MNQWQIILLTAGATAAACALVFGLIMSHQRRQELLRQDLALEQAMADRNESQAILGALQIGLIAYGSDGTRLMNNAAGTIMLPVVPQTFADFLSLYGEANGIQTALLLGNTTANGLLTLEDRIYLLEVQRKVVNPKRSVGHIVTIQDITQQEREERQRKDFVANVSHELKTPLTTIKTYSESLLDWGLEEKRALAVRKDVTRIYEDSLRMEKLIADLLLLSSIDSQGLYMRVEQVDLAYLVRQNVERLLPQAESKQISLSFQAMTAIPPVYFDRSAMERIVINLLSNAIKYTEKSGEIKVYMGHLVDEIYIKFKDNGLGISEEFQQRIFDRFYRVDTTGSRQYGGTGLGLSIVRELVELHQGRINLKSNLGQGSEFTVLFPSAAKVLQDTILHLRNGERVDDLVALAAVHDLQEISLEMGLDCNFEHLNSDQAEILLAKVSEKDENGLGMAWHQLRQDEFHA